MSGRNIDQRLLEIKGVRKPENREHRSAVKACARCGHVNPPTGRYCAKCALSLDFKAALDLEGARKKADDLMSELLEDKEVQSFLRRKLAQVARST